MPFRPFILETGIGQMTGPCSYLSFSYFIKKSQQLYSVFPLLPNLLQLRRRQKSHLLR